MEAAIITGSWYTKFTFKEGNVELGKLDANIEDEYVKLWNFHINEAFRGLELGLQAIEMVKEHFKDRKLWLYVYKDNIAAIKVYERAGFRIEPKDYYTNAYQMTYKPQT